MAAGQMCKSSRWRGPGVALLAFLCLASIVGPPACVSATSFTDTDSGGGGSRSPKDFLRRHLLSTVLKKPFPMAPRLLWEQINGVAEVFSTPSEEDDVSGNSSSTTTTTITAISATQMSNSLDAVSLNSDNNATATSTTSTPTPSPLPPYVCTVARSSVCLRGLLYRCNRNLRLRHTGTACERPCFFAAHFVQHGTISGCVCRRKTAETCKCYECNNGRISKVTGPNRTPMPKLWDWGPLIVKQKTTEVTTNTVAMATTPPSRVAASPQTPTCKSIGQRLCHRQVVLRCDERLVARRTGKRCGASCVTPSGLLLAHWSYESCRCSGGSCQCRMCKHGRLAVVKRDGDLERIRASPTATARPAGSVPGDINLRCKVVGKTACIEHRRYRCAASHRLVLTTRRQCNRPCRLYVGASVMKHSDVSCSCFGHSAATCSCLRCKNGRYVSDGALRQRFMRERPQKQ